MFIKILLTSLVISLPLFAMKRTHDSNEETSEEISNEFSSVESLMDFKPFAGKLVAFYLKSSKDTSTIQQSPSAVILDGKSPHIHYAYIRNKTCAYDMHENIVVKWLLSKKVLENHREKLVGYESKISDSTLSKITFLKIRLANNDELKKIHHMIRSEEAIIHEVEEMEMDNEELKERAEHRKSLDHYNHVNEIGYVNHKDGICKVCEGHKKDECEICNAYQSYQERQKAREISKTITIIEKQLDSDKL